MLVKRYAWKLLAALIGAAMLGSWMPEAMGQAGTEEARAEAMRAKPLKGAPLEMLPQEPIEQKPGLPDRWVILEEFPELIGGVRSLLREVRYPESARKEGIEGRVILSFIVNEQGRVENAVVLGGIGGGCDAEALRVIRQARFKPGAQTYRKLNGDLVREAVKVHMTLPITFRLSRPENRRATRRQSPR